MHTKCRTREVNRRGLNLVAGWSAGALCVAALAVAPSEARGAVPSAADALTADSTFALYVDAARLKGTGFWKAVQDQWPALEEQLKGKLAGELGASGDLNKLKELPNFPWDALAEVVIVTRGQLHLGGGQKSSKDAALVAAARFGRAADVAGLINGLLAQLDANKPGTKAAVERTRRKVGGAEMVDLPAGFFEGQELPFTMSLAGVSAGEATWLGVGRTETLQALLQRRGPGGGVPAAKRYVPAGAQVWLYAPVPAEASQALAAGDNPLAQANPMLGPLAQGLKDVRELAAALTFGERNLDILLALGCADGRTSSELGTGLQGFLGLIQSAAAQNPAASPSVVRNLKVAVDGATVRVITTVTAADLAGTRGGARGRPPATAAVGSAPAAEAPSPVAAPLTAEFAGLNPGEEESVRWGRVRLRNSGGKAVRSAQLRFVYLDKAGRTKGEWVRRHTDLEADVLVGPGTTRVSETPVIQMPAGTEQIRVTVLEVEFTDGSRWKPGR